MRTIPAALLLVVLAIGVSPVIAGPAAGLTGDAEAKIESDASGRYMVTRSRSYQLGQFAYHERTIVRTAVIETEVRHRRRLSDDLGNNGDETGTVTITVHPVNPAGHFDPPLATRKLPGDEVKYQGSSSVTVTSWGCCVESPAETELGLNTLKTLYVRSGSVPLLTFTRLGKPAVARIVSFYVAFTPADEQVLGKDQSAVAVITWSADEEPLQRILVRLTGDKARETAMDWNTSVGWKVGSAPLETHTVLDPAKPTKPVMVWSIAEGKKIELPLVNDRFDLKSAKLPPGVTLQESGLDR
jgi:hypothetical protein